MKVYSGIIVLFALYLTLWVGQNDSDYNNEAGNCYNSTYYIQCYINNNDTQAIKSLLSNGSRGTEYLLYVYKRYALDTGYLTLDIDISQNIRSLHLHLSYSYNHEQIILRASSINTELEYIHCDQPVKLESHNFFNQFKGLTDIYFSDVVSNNLPSFSKLDNLRYLTARIKTGGNQVLESSFVSGLTRLYSLNLGHSSFTSISERAFENMDSLYYLYLDHNKISSLGDNAFRGLTYLRYLSLEDNGLQDVSYNAFKDLNRLTHLNLNENPEFALPAILKLQNLRNLYINFNNYQTIEPYVFQQMKKLTSIYMNNPFTCDCNLKWASIVSQFGIHIIGSYCLDPIDKFGRLITNEDSYTNCTQTESYLCFDSSSICESHEVCHNTQDSYYCGCPAGYDFNNIGHCNDIDECQNISDCQHSCVNTDGTYHCACDVGYKLSANRYDCEDINECQEGNGGCQSGCENTIGSYQCYCEVWQKLYDQTSCTIDIQCELVSSNYNPVNCDNTESVLNCKRGFNLSVINLPCIGVNEQVAMTTMQTNHSTQSTTMVITPQATFKSSIPTLALIIFLLIGVITQSVVIIVLIIFIAKMMRQMRTKVRAPINLEFPTNPPPQESKYGFLNEGAENLKQAPPEMGTIQSQTEINANVTLPEPYPGNMEDGSVYMSAN